MITGERDELGGGMAVLRVLGPWSDFAVCKAVGVDAMHPLETDEVAVARAIMVCQGCPVRQLCLEHALDHHEVEGVWGGMGPVQRRRLLKRRSSAGAR